MLHRFNILPNSLVFVQVVELIGKENVQLTTKQLDEILQLLDKEEILEMEDQIEKALGKNTTEGKTTTSSNKGEPHKSNFLLSLIYKVYESIVIRILHFRYITVF